MIISIPEMLTFPKDPHEGDMCYLGAGMSLELSARGFMPDAAYICKKVYEIAYDLDVKSNLVSLKRDEMTVKGVRPVDPNLIISDTSRAIPFPLMKTSQANLCLFHVTEGTDEGTFVIQTITGDDTSCQAYIIRTAKKPDDLRTVYINETNPRVKFSVWTRFSTGNEIRNANLPKPPAMERRSFTGRDYKTFSDEELSLLKKNYQGKFNEFATSSMGMMLVDLFAYLGENFSWYMDFVSGEMSIEDAKLKESVARWARFLGHKPKAAIGARGWASFTLKRKQTKDVIIPKGTRLQTKSGVIFETIEEKKFSPRINASDSTGGTTLFTYDPSYDLMPALETDEWDRDFMYDEAGNIVPRDVVPYLGDPDTTAGSKLLIKIMEGETYVKTFTGTRHQWQEYEITGIEEGKEILMGSATLTVSGSTNEWEEVEFIEPSPRPQYEIDYFSTPPRLKFGNGNLGLMPDANSEIILTMKVGYGLSGSVASGSITTLLDTIYVDSSAVDLEVTNPLNTFGGSDSEDMEETRRLAPLTHFSSKVCITQEDWDTLASDFADPMYGSTVKLM